MNDSFSPPFFLVIFYCHSFLAPLCTLNLEILKMDMFMHKNRICNHIPIQKERFRYFNQLQVKKRSQPGAHLCFSGLRHFCLFFLLQEMMSAALKKTWKLCCFCFQFLISSNDKCYTHTKIDFGEKLFRHHDITHITIRIWNGKRDAINVTKATKATFSCAFIFCSFMSGAMLLKIYMYNYSIDSLLRTTLMTYFMMTQLYSVPDVMRGYLFILHVSVLCCILSNWSISCRVLNHHNDQVLCLHCLTFFPLSLRLRMHQKSKEFFILTLLIISAHNVVVDVVVGH